MKYELKSVKIIGNPYTAKIFENNQIVEKYGINIVIITGIQGQTYNGFCNQDSMFYELDKNLSINANQQNMNKFAENFVSTTYPNT